MFCCKKRKILEISSSASNYCSLPTSCPPHFPTAGRVRRQLLRSHLYVAIPPNHLGYPRHANLRFLLLPLAQRCRSHRSRSLDTPTQRSRHARPSAARESGEGRFAAKRWAPWRDEGPLRYTRGGRHDASQDGTQKPSYSCLEPIRPPSILIGTNMRRHILSVCGPKSRSLRF